MKPILLVVHIFVTIALITLILLQNSKGGLGGGLGAGQLYRSRRGAEKIVFTATITAAVLFFITSILNLVIR
jgi:preprotein translocase subunit SecG